MIAADLTPALAYVRRNDGPAMLGDAADRQRTAIKTFASHAGYEVVAEFCDGEGPVYACPGFAAALKRIEASGVQTLIVASMDHFARDPVERAVGCELLRNYGIDLVAANDAPRSEEAQCVLDLVQQSLAAAAGFDKALTAGSYSCGNSRSRALAAPPGHKTRKNRPGVTRAVEGER